MTFSPDTQANCDTTNDTSQGITFSTGGIAQERMMAQCFNMDEVFTANTTESRNLTSSYYNSPALSGINPQVIFSWSTSNKSKFNPNTNYSRVWYQQNNDGNTQSTIGEVGDGGMQSLRVFTDRDCRETSQPTSDSDIFNCLTEVSGICNTASYIVKSFYIAKGPGKDGKCTIPKSAGVLSGVGQRGMGAIAAGVATLVSAILVL